MFSLCFVFKNMQIWMFVNTKNDHIHIIFFTTSMSARCSVLLGLISRNTAHECNAGLQLTLKTLQVSCATRESFPGDPGVVYKAGNIYSRLYMYEFKMLVLFSHTSQRSLFYSTQPAVTLVSY